MPEKHPSGDFSPDFIFDFFKKTVGMIFGSSLKYKCLSWSVGYLSPDTDDTDYTRMLASLAPLPMVAASRIKKIIPSSI